MTSFTHKIFVAMSGGVDSSVVAALLAEEGHDVSGITMCFELPPTAASDRPRCCGLDSIEDARRVCRALGIPHHVLNYGDALEELVIKDFVSEYSLGRTPNPCIRCNRYLKFDRLFKDVQALGGTHLATGHYARIENDASGWVMKKGVDPRKDQSYFLYSVPKALLPFVLFPLGHLRKAEVRDIARRLELPVAEKRESQDLCFVPKGKYQDLLENFGGSCGRPGLILDSAGKAVGEHQGIGRYTIGQREGLGVALGQPVFIYRIDPAANTIHVGPMEKLFSAGLLASGLNLVSIKFFQETIDAGIKIRYNHEDISGRVDFLDEDRVCVRFTRPEKSVTPGQAVVFYRGDVLLGGAVIDEPLTALVGVKLPE